MNIPQDIQMRILGLMQTSSLYNGVRIFNAGVDELVETLFVAFTKEVDDVDSAIEDIVYNVEIDEVGYHRYIKYCDFNNMDEADDYNEFRYVLRQIITEVRHFSKVDSIINDTVFI